MRKILVLLALSMMLLASCSSPTAPATDRLGITLTDCILTSPLPGTQAQVDAQCGSLTVRENPADAESRQILLNIAVVPSISRSPEPDPLVILVGGPGQSAIETFPALYSTVFRIHEKRDILLVDQRGTGKSNPLRCLDPEEAQTLEDEEVIALLQDCPGKLRADLRYYTTDIAMQDLDTVRAALGYESVNLFGVSYGTRAALTYLKMFPERVRSMVLDAVVDPAFILFMDAAQDGQDALEQFFRRCEGDKACSSTFPELRTEFDALLKKLEETPPNVTIRHPVSGKLFVVRVTRSLFTSAVFNTLYSPDLVAMLPLTIHQAYAEDNFAPLISQAYLLDAGIYDGMFYAVACTEDAPLLPAEEPRAESIFGESAGAFIQVCSAWPQGEAAPVLREPVRSDVPALLLSGEADPITPPWHAEQLALSLSNSLHLVFDDMGHGNSSNQCTAKILENFIESASLEGLDPTCAERVEPPPFFVDFSGPQP